MESLKKKKILIAVDYNPTAREVAEQGYALSKIMNADVVLLHVIAESTYYITGEYDPIMGFPGFANINYTKSENLKESITAFLNKTKEHLNDENIQICIGEGEYSHTIISTATELQADIIVMGSLSRRWLENIVLGSVTENVLRHTPIPLYIIPTRKMK